jgi:hypothetical protein
VFFTATRTRRDEKKNNNERIRYFFLLSHLVVVVALSSINVPLFGECYKLNKQKVRDERRERYLKYENKKPNRVNIRAREMR